MKMTIPAPLKTEHDELHEELVKATKEPGKVGAAARAVADALHPHFLKEEEYALPPLGLLKTLTEEMPSADREQVIGLTDRLKADLPAMLEEHKVIVSALSKLADAAREENKPEYVRFTEKLVLHAQTEEEVLYPASILLGEYLKLRRAGEPAYSL